MSNLPGRNDQREFPFMVLFLRECEGHKSPVLLGHPAMDSELPSHASKYQQQESQNCRHGKAESDRRIHVVGKAELGASVRLGSHFFDNGGGFSKR